MARIDDDNGSLIGLAVQYSCSLVRDAVAVAESASIGQMKNVTILRYRFSGK